MMQEAESNIGTAMIHRQATGLTLASPWAKQQFAQARLIAGGRVADAPPGTIAAGVEIELADGWKTYWRNPGSSGVPPLFDWSAASNLASAEVRYPAPTRYGDRGGDTIGYKHRLIFPIVVRPADPQRRRRARFGQQRRESPLRPG